MRINLHSYPDEKAIALLKITAKTMSTDLVLVIDELVVPYKGAHTHANQFDSTMLETPISRTYSLQTNSRILCWILRVSRFWRSRHAPTSESVIVVVLRA